MKSFVSAQQSPSVSAYARALGVSYAGLLTILALAQLFTFEDFIEILPAAVGAPNSQYAGLLAPLIVVCEVFALPYLLRMSVSPAFRGVSMVFGWLVPLFWLIVAITGGVMALNTGILGSLVMMDAANTMILSLLLFVIGAYVQYHFFRRQRNST